jgi:hypothetical protein
MKRVILHYTANTTNTDAPQNYLAETYAHAYTSFTPA